MRKQFKQFLLRWAVCSAGLFLASVLISTVEIRGSKPIPIILGGLIVAIVNAVIKPIVVILSLPAIMLSLGLFTIIINGFMVALASWVYGPLNIETFGAAVLTGGIIGVLNFVITRVVEGGVKERS